MPRTLTEAAGFTLDPRGTGKFLVKLIDAGEGSSAIYTPEVLRQAAADKIFPAGTHMYLDHADETRRGGYGERSVRDLVSVLTADAWFDESLQALVSEALAVAGHADTLESLAPHVGLSISAIGEVAPPKTPGEKPILKRLVAAESVDWVTHAGRGGQVLAILEAAGQPVREAATDDRRDQLCRALNAAHPRRDDDPEAGAWLHDFDDTARLCWYQQGDRLWRQPYTVADDDQSVTLTGTPTEVRAVTHYLPITTDGASITESAKEETTVDINEARYAELLDAEKRVATLESERDALTAERDSAITDRDEALAKLTAAQEAEARHQAQLTATERIDALTEGEAPALVQRIKDAILPTIEAELPADLDTKVTDMVAAEKAYLASFAEARLTGFGATTHAGATPSTSTDDSPRRTVWDRKH